MDLGLAGRVAVVMGASQGIGRAVADELAGEGARVAISARALATLEQVRANLIDATGAEALAVPADCTRPDEVRALFATVLERWGRVDILVNSVPGPPTAPFEELSDDGWHRAFDVKLMGQIRSAREAFPHMVRQGWGRIINIVGTHGHQPQAYAITAGVVNAGLLNFTKALAELGAPHQVLVNAVNPGPIETARMRYLGQVHAQKLGISPEESKAHLAREVLLRRYGEPKEVAAAIAFLASERASYITGAMINVDGGQTKGL